MPFLVQLWSYPGSDANCTAISENIAMVLCGLLVFIARRKVNFDSSGFLQGNVDSSVLWYCRPTVLSLLMVQLMVKFQTKIDGFPTTVLIFGDTTDTTVILVLLIGTTKEEVIESYQ